jgi:hypothetical protein
MVDDMHVQMRFGRAAGIADVTEDLRGGYMVANFNRHRSRAHMSVENVMMLSDIDDNVVTARVDEVDIDGILAGMRNILWQAVHRRYHRALGDAVDRRVVAKVACVLVLRSGPGRRLAAHHTILHPSIAYRCANHGLPSSKRIVRR